MADRPNAAASVWTIDPDEIPSTDHRPAARPCATLRVTMYSVSWPGVRLSSRPLTTNSQKC